MNLPDIVLFIHINIKWDQIRNLYSKSIQYNKKHYSPAVKQQISEVAFKIWLKHETFLIYRILCAESNKIETHFQCWSEICVNWEYLSASDGNLFCIIRFQLSWPTCFASFNKWSKMNCLHELYINGTISWIVVIWNIFVYWEYDF